MQSTGSMGIYQLMFDLFNSAASKQMLTDAKQMHLLGQKWMKLFLTK